MPIASIRRRVGRLEGSGLFVSRIDYPPLTSEEIGDAAYRVQVGEPLTREEVDRLHRQSPVIDGEFMITAYRRQVYVKRYPGMDVSEF